MTQEESGSIYELKAQIKNLCTGLNEIKADIKDLKKDLQHKDERNTDNCDACKNEIYKNMGSKLDKAWFKWLIIIIIGVISGAVGSNLWISHENSKNIVGIQETLKTFGEKLDNHVIEYEGTKKPLKIITTIDKESGTEEVIEYYIIEQEN